MILRVVLDTNVVVSAMLRSGSVPDAILRLAIAEDVRGHLSEAILAEYEEVLRRPHFLIDTAKIVAALAQIRQAFALVRPLNPVSAALDPDDNRFLEFLVTGNIRHFPERWGPTNIITPRDFMNAYALSLDEP